MEPASPHDVPALTVLEEQVRQSYGLAVYTHKTHEKCADLLVDQQWRIKVAQIVLSAVTTAGFLAAVLGERWAAVVGLVVSAVLFALNAYTKEFDPGETAQKHRRAAADLWLVRERYLSLIADIRLGRHPVEKLLTRRDKLIEQTHALYVEAPSTTPKAYRKAQEALKEQEELTFSDAELDAFLPAALRKGSSGEAGGERAITVESGNDGRPAGAKTPL